MKVTVPDFVLTDVVFGKEGHLKDELRGRILAHGRKYAGVSFDIVIKQHEEQRSLDQNAYWHAEVFPKVAEFMGATIEEAKLVLMGECWGWHRVAGRDVPVKPRTSSMTIAEGVYFTDWVIPWAVDHCDGLQIMLPNEWQRRQTAA